MFESGFVHFQNLPQISILTVMYVKKCKKKIPEHFFFFKSRDLVKAYEIVLNLCRVYFSNKNMFSYSKKPGPLPKLSVVQGGMV